MEAKKLNHIPSPLRPRKEWSDLMDQREYYTDSYRIRLSYIRDHAWCILTKESAIQLGRFLSRFNRVVEPFAGTGYIAHHLRKESGLGRNYRAYDPMRSHWDNAQRPNYGFTRKGCFNINLKKADCVVMCWPNYNENLAYRIARKMVAGQYLVYQGEGHHGCTGDDKFHEYLDENFTCLSFWEKKINHGHARWSGIYDEWHVYVKKESK